MKKKKSELKRESIIFLIVGITAVLIDVSTYIVLIKITRNFTLSKSISFILGAIFSYFGNKVFTFQTKTKKLTPIFFSITYTSSLLINIFINNYTLSFFKIKSQIIIFFAFLISSFFSATFNYLTMIFFIFKK